MRTNVFLGKNLSKLDFNYGGTIRLFGNGSNKALANACQDIFERTNEISQLYYGIEKSFSGCENHAHLLTEIRNPNSLTLETILINLNPQKVIRRHRKTLIKQEVAPSYFSDKLFEIPTTKIITRKMELHIEPIIEGVNSALYATKQSSFGLNNGYFFR